MPYKDLEEQRKYQREWTARRKTKWFADKFCVICGSTENLELDHIDRQQKVSHKIWSWSWPRIEAEVEKCQVLCGIHHKEKTKNEWKDLRQHGRTLYSHGCRCEICFTSQQKHNAQRYNKINASLV